MLFTYQEETERRVIYIEPSTEGLSTAQAPGRSFGRGTGDGAQITPSHAHQHQGV